MILNWNRILSVSVAVLYIVTESAATGFAGALITLGFVILPLACIWFSETMGNYVGTTSSMPITQKSPGIMVCIAGWVLLLMPIIVMIVSALLEF